MRRVRQLLLPAPPAALFSVVGVLAALLGGCTGPMEDLGALMMAFSFQGQLAAEERLEELPDLAVEVATVEEQCSEFEQPADHPLLDVPAGTVLDDLRGLDGCWGACASPELLQAPAFVAADIEFYRFDFSTNRMTYQVVQRGGSFLDFDVFLEDTYSLEISGPDRITVRLIAASSSSTLASLPDVQGPLEVVDAEPFDLQITLMGDAFKFGDSLGASPDFSGPHRACLVFFRFECPD